MSEITLPGQFRCVYNLSSSILLCCLHRGPRGIAVDQEKPVQESVQFCWIHELRALLGGLKYRRVLPKHSYPWGDNE